jgi:transposase
VLEEAHDSEELIARVAALDIGKAQLVCCVRVPSPEQPGKRLQEVKSYPTMTRGLVLLGDWLASFGVTLVGMESTGVYWKPVVRHEVPRVRAEVEGLRLRSVAAGR